LLLPLPLGMTQPEIHKECSISEPRINDRIRVPEVRLVGPGGEQVGVVRVEDALRLAQEADLDLVEVAPDARPPVAKLMDFGKFKYESDVKARDARRKQANTALKEIRFRLKIDAHDYETKKGHVVRFLEGGDKVKVMIMFRGREQSRPEMGIRLLQRLAEDVSDLGSVESSPRQDGRNMTMVIGPHRKKSDARNEQLTKRAAEKEARRASQADKPATKAQPEPKTDASEPAPNAPVIEAPVFERAPRSATTTETRPASSPRPASSGRSSSSSRPASSSGRPAPRSGSSAPRSGTSAPRSTSSAPRSGSPRPSGSGTSSPRPASSTSSQTTTGGAAAGASKPAATPKPASGSSSAAPKPGAPKPSATPKPTAPKPSSKGASA
jgi:translation initiation factor IF-3